MFHLTNVKCMNPIVIGIVSISFLNFRRKIEQYFLLNSNFRIKVLIAENIIQQQWQRLSSCQFVKFEAIKIQSINVFPINFKLLQKIKKISFKKKKFPKKKKKLNKRRYFRWNLKRIRTTKHISILYY